MCIRDRYGLAKAENLSESILKEISILNQSFKQEPRFLRLISTPNLSKQERCQILDNCFAGNVHPYVLNFLKILTKKGYASHFSDCFAAYREHYNLDHGILPVSAVTCVPLSKDQEQRLSEKLAKIIGKTVELENRVARCV